MLIKTLHKFGALCTLLSHFLYLYHSSQSNPVNLYFIQTQSNSIHGSSLIEISNQTQLNCIRNSIKLNLWIKFDCDWQTSPIELYLKLDPSFVKQGPGSWQGPAVVLVGIPRARCWQLGFLFPVGSRQDSRREVKFLAAKILLGSYANLTKILSKKQIHGSQNLGTILLGIPPRLVVGSKVLGEIPYWNLGKMLDVLLRIYFGAQCLHA